MAMELRLKIKLTLILFFLNNNIFAQNFEPKELYFKGYIHEYYNDEILFKVLLKSKNQCIDFKFDKSSKTLFFMDTNINILFWGSIYHNTDPQMTKLYHNIPWYNFYKTIPIFKSNNNFYNKSDSLLYYHRVTKRKVKFYAYNYQEYLPYKNNYGELNTYGIYYTKQLYPEMLLSKNKFFIVNYFAPFKFFVN